MENARDHKILLVCLAFLILLGCWAYELSCNRRMKKTVDRTQAENQQLAEYVISSFSFRQEPWTQPGLVALVEENKDKICLVVPRSVCRACVTTLLLILREESISEDRALIFLEPDPVVDIQEFRALGYEDIRILEKRIIPEWMTDVFLVKYNSAGWWPIYFPFQDGREAILKLFLKE